jgi:hypothetical protein
MLVMKPTRPRCCGEARYHFVVSLGSCACICGTACASAGADACSSALGSAASVLFEAVVVWVISTSPCHS